MAVTHSTANKTVRIQDVAGLLDAGAGAETLEIERHVAEDEDFLLLLLAA